MQRLVNKLRQTIAEYLKEKDMIITTTAKFAHFMAYNSLTSYSDGFEHYVDHAIANEEGPYYVGQLCRASDVANQMPD